MQVERIPRAGAKASTRRQNRNARARNRKLFGAPPEPWTRFSMWPWSHYPVIVASEIMTLHEDERSPTGSVASVSAVEMRRDYIVFEREDPILPIFPEILATFWIGLVPRFPDDLWRCVETVLDCRVGRSREKSIKRRHQFFRVYGLWPRNQEHPISIYSRLLPLPVLQPASRLTIFRDRSLPALQPFGRNLLLSIRILQQRHAAPRTSQRVARYSAGRLLSAPEASSFSNQCFGRTCRIGT